MLINWAGAINARRLCDEIEDAMGTPMAVTAIPTKEGCDIEITHMGGGTLGARESILIGQIIDEHDASLPSRRELDRLEREESRKAYQQYVEQIANDDGNPDLQALARAFIVLQK
jgi:hypothetical protein